MCNGDQYGRTPQNRKAELRLVTAKQEMGVIYESSGRDGIPIPRPFLGGIMTGFHAMPSFGTPPSVPADQMLVLHEAHNRPYAVVSATDFPEKLPVLKPGESAIYHPDGRVLCWSKTDGSTTIFQDSTGHVIISIDAASATTIGRAGDAVHIAGPVDFTNQTAAGAGGSFPASYSGTIPISWNGSVRNVPYL